MLFTRRDLTRIIVPLMIEQALAVTIGMFDSMMVSTAGEAAVSGVALVDSVNLLLVYLFSALAAGGAVVISQFLGKKDFEAANSSAKQLSWVVLIVSSFIMIFSLVFRKPLLRLIFGAIEYDVMKNAQIYFLFTAMSFPFLGLYNSGAATFRAMGNSRISMIASIIMNILNITGNAILIFIFHMGAAGAAIATLFSRVVGAFIMMILLRNKDNIVYIEKFFHFKPDFAIIKNICRIGIPNGLENGMFHFGKVLTQSLVSTFGTVQIAANAVANAVTHLQYIPGTAIGLAMVTIVGRCIGAQEKQQAKQYAMKLLRIAYFAIVAISVLICVFLKPLISLYSLSFESGQIACQIIILHSICVSTIWPLAFTLPNSFRAASDVKYTMIISMLSMWIFRVGLSYALGGYFNFGVIGIWIAMFCDWLFRAIIFIIRYFNGKWLTKYKPLEVKND